jgi:hypothetical protein
MAEREEKVSGVTYRIVRVEDAPDEINPLRPTPAMRIIVYVTGLGYKIIYIPKSEMNEAKIKEAIKKEYEEKWKYETMGGVI